MVVSAGWGVGHILRKRRKQLGLTLTELGVATLTHPSIIGRVELGERRATAELLLRLAPPLDFSRFELLSLAGYLNHKGG